MGRNRLVAIVVALAAAGCGSASAGTPVATTTTIAPPPVTVTTTTTVPKPQVTPPTTATAKPKPPAVTTTTGGGGGGTTASVDAVTDDGAVLTLDDGSVYSVDPGDQSTVSSWSSGDSVTVDDGQDAIFNTSTGESVSVSYIGDSSDSNPYSGSGSSIQAKSDDGSIIVLDDGSIWIVDAADQATSGPWVDATSITVSQNPEGSYELVDTDDQESVAANYIGQE